jgi:nicotinate-nucleotide adenylyltransferase
LRIALIGGTFNPIHYAHLRCAEEIRIAFKLDQVIFIPAGDPPHKTSEDIIPSRLRYAMTEMAVKDNSRFAVSDIELKREGKSYSVDTILHFLDRMEPEDQLYFILGSDAFRDIGIWKDYIRLFSLCHFIVISRPNYDISLIKSTVPAGLAARFTEEDDGFTWRHQSGFAVFFHEVTAMDISGSMIRNLIKEEISIRYLVPPDVEAFIEKKRLYR